MAHHSSTNGIHEMVLNVNADASKNSDDKECVPLVQKLVAELLGTYILIFTGCASIVVNDNDKVITLPGVAIVWGLTIMALVYSLGHISGAHFNPAITIAQASTKRFPIKEVPAYIVAQLVGSILASGTLRLIFNGHQNQFAGTVPTGSDIQAFVIEFITTFYVMLVISGVATDDRAVGELTGLAAGATVLLNVMIAGPITGASMNPARTLGQAIIHHEYKGIWIFLVATILGAVAGTWAYYLIGYRKKPVPGTKSASFLKEAGNGRAN